MKHACKTDQIRAAINNLFCQNQEDSRELLSGWALEKEKCFSKGKTSSANWKRKRKILGICLKKAIPDNKIRLPHDCLMTKWSFCSFEESVSTPWWIAFPISPSWNKFKGILHVSRCSSIQAVRQWWFQLVLTLLIQYGRHIKSKDLPFVCGKTLTTTGKKNAILLHNCFKIFNK